MATTTNYGWTTPDDTALVKDGASAIRSLGSSIDTTTKNLNPETTLGDISYRSSTSNTNTRLAIGSTGQVLTVSGGVPAWASPAATTPSSNWTYIGGLSIASGTSTGAFSLSGYNRYRIIGYFQTTGGSSNPTFKLNNSSTAVYDYIIQANRYRNNANNQIQVSDTTTGTSFPLGPFTGLKDGIIKIDIDNANSSSKPWVFWEEMPRVDDGSVYYGEPSYGNGQYNSNINLSSVDFTINNNGGSYFRAYGLN